MTADNDLVEAFNAKFGLTATPETVSRVLGSPHVRAWYKEYRQTLALEASIPAHWRDLGLTAAEWSAMAVARKARQKTRAACAAAIASASRTFNDAVQTANTTCERNLQVNSSPMLLALEGGYEQLPLAVQVSIESNGPGDARDAALKEALETARRQWIIDARAGRRPF
jgi:hypothetical protein